METEIETLKAAKPTDGARVIKAQERNTMLSGLKRTWDEVEELKKEIPELRKRVTLLKSAIDESKEAVQESNNSLDLLKVDLDMATKLKTEVHMYDEYQKEIQRTEDTITQLEKKRDPKAKGTANVLLCYSELQSEVFELIFCCFYRMLHEFGSS